MAGIAGLEPTHTRVKVWCLTDLAISQYKTYKDIIQDIGHLANPINNHYWRAWEESNPRHTD